MRNKFIHFWNNYTAFYRIVLFLSATLILLLSFPREGKFKYEFQKNKPWLNEDLIAPFDFAILKTESELKVEQENALIDSRFSKV